MIVMVCSREQLCNSIPSLPCMLGDVARAALPKILRIAAWGSSLVLRSSPDQHL